MVYKKITIILVSVLFLAVLVASQPPGFDPDEEQGTFGTPNNSMENSYALGQNVSGWVNASFEEESGSNVFSDSEGNSINLLTLLNSDSRHEFSCEPENCNFFYDASNPSSTKSINLDQGESTIKGFVLNSDISEINNFSLQISEQGNSGPSCSTQLEIDLLDDGSVETGNHKMASSLCSGLKNYGCFDTSGSSNEATISTGDTYCQKITLPKAPGFETGVWLKNESGKLNLSMRLFDQNGNGLDEANCNLKNSEITQEGGEVSCDINYQVTEQGEHYVCVQSEGEFSGEYKLKFSDSENLCGFHGNPASGLPEESAKYQIYAQPYQFDSIGNLNIDNSLAQGATASQLIEDYLFDEYGDLDCGNENCIIPLRINSQSGQDISLSGSIEYDSGAAGSGIEDSEIYDLSKEAPLINSSYQKIFFDNANFTLPEEAGKYNYTLNFKGNKILTKEISIESGATLYSINPQQTAVALPTTFVLNYGEKNVSEFTWHFDNETTKTTTENQVEHTYSEQGNKTIEVIAEDIDGITSSKEFEISVGSAGSVLDEQISKKEDSLENLRDQISDYAGYSSTAIEKSLNLSNLESEISEIDSEYSLGSGNVSDEDLLQRILAINIPDSISQSSQADSITLAQSKSDISLISAEESSENFSIDSNLEEEYENEIQRWALENVEVSVSGGSYSADYGSGGQPLVTAFTLDLNGPNEDYSIFIPKSQGLSFEENWQETSSHYYREISGDSTLNFYSSGEESFEDISFFVSPRLESLEVVEQSEGTPEEAGEEFNWLLYGLIALGVLVLGGIAYYFLKKWYDQRYEDYLFKDKNKLYNLVMYVQKAKMQGKPDSEIKNSLRSNWSNEQINYILKKFKGKEVTLPSFGLISSNGSQPKKKKSTNKKFPKRKRPPVKKALTNKKFPKRKR